MVLQSSQERRDQLKRLNEELRQQKRNALEAQAKALIIQLLIQNKTDLAAEKYELVRKHLTEGSLREVSMYVHVRMDSDVIPVLFPDLPPPYTCVEFDSTEGLMTVEDQEREVENANAKLEKLRHQL